MKTAAACETMAEVREGVDAIDRFAWHMLNVEGVQDVIALPRVAKAVNAGWNEGSMKWRVLPRENDSMVQAVSRIDTSTGLLNKDCSVMPVTTEALLAVAGGVVPSTAPTSMPKRHFMVKAIFETRSSPSCPTRTVVAP